MFDKKSDYAQNKHSKDAIVYPSATGRILLTRKDFASEDEFQKWKDWSDGDYRDTEQAVRGFYDNEIPFNDKLEILSAVLSVEDELFSRLEETEHRQLSAVLIAQLMNRLTKKQYRRLWLCYVKNLSERDIAEMEHVGQQRVSKSILSGKKIFENFFKYFSKTGGKKTHFSVISEERILALSCSLKIEYTYCRHKTRVAERSAI